MGGETRYAFPVCLPSRLTWNGADRLLCIILVCACPLCVYAYGFKYKHVVFGEFSKYRQSIGMEKGQALRHRGLTSTSKQGDMLGIARHKKFRAM